VTRRFHPTDAFVDESIRAQRYLMGSVLIEQRHLSATRAAVVALPTRGRRLHFNSETDSQRRLLLTAIAELPIRALVVVCHRSHGVTEFAAREACLAALVTEAQNRSVERLVIESRQDDREDARVITRGETASPTLTFEHRRGHQEPMLGLADAITLGRPRVPRGSCASRRSSRTSWKIAHNAQNPGSPTYGWATGSTSSGTHPRHPQYGLSNG
jgi:hypothetical protein